MKLNPENFVEDESLCLNYKSFFISGNDEGYILSLMDLLVKNFVSNGFVKKKYNEDMGSSNDLFGASGKYVYICDKFIGNSAVEELEKNNDILIFYEKNSPKNKPFKQFFSKSKDRVLLECYELDQAKKKNILNGFVKKHGLILEKNTYWFLLELLDSRFPVLVKELEKVILLDDINDTVGIASALNFEKSEEANKFFFKIYLTRAEIASLLHSSVGSIADFYSYFSYFKIYTFLMLESKNKSELENKIPKFLFKEKSGLLSLFEKLNKNKKNLLSSLVFKTERLVRKNPNLYKLLFFRFVLNYKKIIF